MKGIQIKQFGDIDDLDFVELPPLPRPARGKVLVRVHAAGLNRADLLQVRGSYPAPHGYSSDLPGLEFAGEVIETGAEVTELSPGDRVMAITAGHAQAEYILADHATLTKIPENLSFAEAAAIPEAFITAHDAVFTQSSLATRETLLIHAVGSGVGLAALQLAKAAGAKVIGTSRTAEKLEKCKEFGLDVGLTVGNEIDFSKQVMEATGGRGADVICDLVGASYFKENLASAALKGRIILVGLTGGANAEFNLGTALSKRMTIRGTVLRARSVEEKTAATNALADFATPLFKNGRMRPIVDRVFPAEEVREAYRYLASNASFGKVVLEF